MSDIIGVQLFEGGKTQYYLTDGHTLRMDALCVVETEHGPSMARVVKAGMPSRETKVNDPLRRIMRIATAKDLAQVQANERLEREAYRLCRKYVLGKDLSMKLVDVTYSLDGRKAVFYFTSENRVDFRELVKELAHALKVKIEMRQIGVRDEARRLGGVGCCGQALCCCAFLKDFVSVSIRMAKEQNVSLNPTKVSGICGRLMCCLSYEYDGQKIKQKKNGTEGRSVPTEDQGQNTEKSCRGCNKILEDTDPNHQNNDAEFRGRKSPKRIGREVSPLSTAPGKPAAAVEAPATVVPTKVVPTLSVNPAAGGERSQGQGQDAKNHPAQPQRRWFKSRSGKQRPKSLGGASRNQASPQGKPSTHPQGGQVKRDGFKA